MRNLRAWRRTVRAWSARCPSPFFLPSFLPFPFKLIRTEAELFCSPRDALGFICLLDASLTLKLQELSRSLSALRKTSEGDDGWMRTMRSGCRQRCQIANVTLCWRVQITAAAAHPHSCLASRSCFHLLVQQRRACKMERTSCVTPSIVGPKK